MIIMEKDDDNMKYRKYIDSDGVIADFRKWVESKGIDMETASPKDIHRVMMENYAECFLALDVIEGRESLMDLAIEDDDVFILTAVPSVDSISREFRGIYDSSKIEKRLLIMRNNKIEWYSRRGVPENKVIICNGTSSKVKWCRPGDVLYDDLPGTVEKWRRMGGIGVLVLN